MKVIVDESRCDGCGLCNIICPEVFDVNVSTLGRRACVRPGVEMGSAEKLFCRVAARHCPTFAIRFAYEQGEYREVTGEAARQWRPVEEFIEA